MAKPKLVPGCYKQPHRSEGAALAHIRALKRLNPSPNDSRLCAYKCNATGCPYWHVGHDPNQRTLAEEIERKNRNRGQF